METEGNWFDPSAPPGAEEAQHLARESSLVCRQNAKLRAQLAELQGQHTEDSEAFRLTLKGRPTAVELEKAQGKSNAAEARAAELERTLQASEERARSLEVRLTEHQQAAAASAQEAHASDADQRGAERGWCKERDRLHAEVDALSVELASWRMLGVDVEAAQGGLRSAAAAGAERAAAAEAARRMIETHAERVAALQVELKEVRELLVALQRGGDETAAGRLRAEVVRAEAHAAELRKQAQTQADANAAALQKQAVAAAQAAKDAETARRKEVEALHEQLSEVRKALLVARQGDRSAREQAEKAADGESSRLAREARAREQQLQRASREAALDRQRADEACAARDAMHAQLDELRRQLAGAHLEIERLSRLLGERSSAPQPPTEPKRSSNFGDFVHLKRELAEVRQANDILSRRLAAGHPSMIQMSNAPGAVGGAAGAAARMPHDAGSDGPPPADATTSATAPVHSRTSLRQLGAPAVPRRYPAALTGDRDRELPGLGSSQRRLAVF